MNEYSEVEERPEERAASRRARSVCKPVTKDRP